MVFISQVLSDCRMTELQNSEIIRIEMKDIPAQPVVVMKSRSQMCPNVMTTDTVITFPLVLLSVIYHQHSHMIAIIIHHENLYHLQTV